MQLADSVSADWLPLPSVYKQTQANTHTLLNSKKEKEVGSNVTPFCVLIKSSSKKRMKEETETL